jgi:hypothetical protein
LFLLIFVVAKHLQNLKPSIDFTAFLLYDYISNLQSIATMPKHNKEEVKILDGKTTIHTNDYGVRSLLAGALFVITKYFEGLRKISKPKTAFE